MVRTISDKKNQTISSGFVWHMSKICRHVRWWRDQTRICPCVACQARLRQIR